MDNNNDNIIDNLDTPENITKEYEDETTYKAHNKGSKYYNWFRW